MTLSKSKLYLSGIICVCLLIAIGAVHFGIANIYKIGLEHRLDSFDNLVSCPHTDNTCLNNELNVIDELVNSMLEWDSLNPDNLSLASYSALVNYHQNLGHQHNKKSAFILDKALALNQSAIMLRPVFPDAYAFRTYLLNDRRFVGQPVSLNTILDVYFKAVRFGPYEIPVAKAGINLLYGHWKTLSKQEIRMAIDYIANYNKFGLNYKTISEVVDQSPQKKTICGIAKFYKSWIKACHK